MELVSRTRTRKLHKHEFRANYILGKLNMDYHIRSVFKLNNYLIIIKTKIAFIEVHFLKVFKIVFPIS